MSKIEHWDCECDDLMKTEGVCYCDNCIILKHQSEDDLWKPGIDIWWNNHATGILVTPETAIEIGKKLIEMGEEIRHEKNK